jgi:hypothetical protein
LRTFSTLTVFAVTGIPGAQSEISPGDLFSNARRRVLADVARIPAYTCVQTTTRSVYGPLVPKKEVRHCDQIIHDRDARKGMPPRLSWERLRLEVAIANKREVYSWVGAKQFEDDDLQRLIGYGQTVVGEFGPLLLSVLSLNESMPMTGETLDGGRRLIHYAYDTPLAWSLYRVKIGGAEMVPAYNGLVSLDPQTGDLAQLTTRSAPVLEDSGYCQVLDEVDYGRLRIGSRDVLLPRAARSWAVASDGLEMANEDSYSSCREYVGESTIRFDDEGSSKPADRQPEGPRRETMRAIPAGLTFDARIVTLIDSRTSAAGDPVEAVLRSPIVSPDGQILAAPGARIHGWLARFVEHPGKRGRKYEYEVGVRFMSIETGGEMGGGTLPFAANLAETSGDTSVPIRLNIQESTR